MTSFDIAPFVDREMLPPQEATILSVTAMVRLLDEEGSERVALLTPETTDVTRILGEIEYAKLWCTTRIESEHRASMIEGFFMLGGLDEDDDE